MPERFRTRDTELDAIVVAHSRSDNRTASLVASETYASEEVLDRRLSVFSNTAGEGEPDDRYYPLCENLDRVERLTQERARQVFSGLKDVYVNAQVHGGANMNEIVFSAAMELHDTVLVPKLAQGGHLTHASPVSHTDEMYHAVRYGVRALDHRIDIDQVNRLAHEHKPKLILAGFSAYPREVDHDAFADIAEKVGARLIIDMSHYAGLVAAGLHHNPVGVADYVTTTTNKTLRGHRSALIFSKREYEAVLKKSVFPRHQAGPRFEDIARKARLLWEVQQPEFRIYAEDVVRSSKLLAEDLQAAGIPVLTGGTDNHTVLVDVLSSRLRLPGNKAYEALARAGIKVNTNPVPYTEGKTFQNPGGLRLGPAPLAARGFPVDAIRQIGRHMIEVLEHADDQSVHERVRIDVAQICLQYPVPSSKFLVEDEEKDRAA